MNAIIIQARMGSSRLPGKVLMKVKNNQTVLHYVINQLKYCTSVKKIIVATTLLPEDDQISELCNDLSIECFRGSEKNVLDRYYQCCKKFSISTIIRIPADKPFIDPTIVDMMMEFFSSNSYDYITNFLPSTVPSGTEVEIFSFDTIKKTWENAVLPSDKEHVTKYIYTNENSFKIFNVKNKKNLSEYRWAVDKIEDLQLVKEIAQRIIKKPILTSDILKIFDNEPDLLKINQSVDHDEGLNKSLNEDKLFLKNLDNHSK